MQAQRQSSHKSKKKNEFIQLNFFFVDNSRLNLENTGNAPFQKFKTMGTRDLDDQSKLQIIGFSMVNGSWLEFGRIESGTPQKENLAVIPFYKPLSIKYLFNQYQQLKFELFQQQQILATSFCSLGQIIGANQNEFVIKLTGDMQKREKLQQNKQPWEGGLLKIKAETGINTIYTVQLHVSCQNIYNTGAIFATSPYIKFVRVLKGNKCINQVLCQTETVSNNLNPVFKQIEFNVNDQTEEILIELWDFNSPLWCLFNDKQLGSLKINVQLMQQNEQSNRIPFIDPQTNAVQGYLIINQFQFYEQFGFLDYISSGLQLCLIGAVDFTLSNKPTTDHDSLHRIYQDGQNDYQKALHSIGQILLDYDYDKRIPMFGFGGIPRMPMLNSNQTMDCFPLNGNPEDPEVYGIDGILQSYQYALQNVQLSGPTHFAPLIKEAMKVAEASKQAQLQNQYIDQYQILLILTDGQIHDMKETLECLVKSAFLPLSIIIVGIGQEDFQNMEILDGDQGLMDYNGNRAQRDLVQFVPFRELQNNQFQLARKVLEELPRQVEEYMRIVRRRPRTTMVGQGQGGGQFGSSSADRQQPLQQQLYQNPQNNQNFELQQQQYQQQQQQPQQQIILNQQQYQQFQISQQQYDYNQQQQQKQLYDIPGDNKQYTQFQQFKQQNNNNNNLLNINILNASKNDQDQLIMPRPAKSEVFQLDDQEAQSLLINNKNDPIQNSNNLNSNSDNKNNNIGNDNNIWIDNNNKNTNQNNETIIDNHNKKENNQ